MFKSIFAKYITAFILILALCFIMLTGIATVTVNKYSQSTKANAVLKASDAASAFIQDQLLIESETACDSAQDFTVYIEQSLDIIGSALSSIATYSDDVMFFVTDTSGRVLLSVKYDTVASPENQQLTYDFIDALTTAEGAKSVSTIEGMFDEPQIASAAAILSANENTVGYIFAFTPEHSLSGLGNAMVKTIFISSIWVMLAAIIAVYVITNKIIEPLKDMRRAARSFASGDFSVRVRVRGRDEVADLATAFNNMANSLEAAEKMRNSFMANVSHDLRTPMTTISGFIDSILDGAIPPEKHNYYLNIIATEVKRLSRLVSQLLDISRIEAGDRKFNFEPFDICEMARQILISFEQKIDKKRLDVEFDSDNDNMYVLADRDAIYQIMYNLCDNAVKFSNERGKLLLGINKNDIGKIVVTIFNDGQGIRPEDLPYVFDRFYKGDKSRGLDKFGVGLGLYISKTIIDAHHETISVDSEYGKYCRFSFTLTNAKDNQHDRRKS